VLHSLPPYSPEANDIERLWQQLPEHVIRNDQHPPMAALLTAVIDLLMVVQSRPTTKGSILPLAITSVAGGV